MYIKAAYILSVQLAKFCNELNTLRQSTGLLSFTQQEAVSEATSDFYLHKRQKAEYESQLRVSFLFFAIWGFNASYKLGNVHARDRCASTHPI